MTWVKDAIFYQIFPDRFATSSRILKPRNLESWDSEPTRHGFKGGDLLGVVERLDWLKDLGVNAIYFNPVFRSGSNHRYHTHDYYVVDPLLGGNDAFDELLVACHKRDIRLVLDGVFNHASRGFFQFHDLLESGPASPWLDWFNVKGFPLHAYDTDVAPNYDAWWNLHALPKFNTDHPEVREYLIQVGEYWIRRGIDGWRLDVPTEVTTPGFWEEFGQRVRHIRPDAYLVGEIWGDASAWVNNGKRFDGTMNYLLTSAILRFAAGDRIDPSHAHGLSFMATPKLDAFEYGEAVAQLSGLYSSRALEHHLNLLGSHDTPRVLSLVSEDVDSVILSLVLMFTFTGAPCIYYGDEIGMTGGPDPACRRAFPWTKDATWNTRLLTATRELIALRKNHAALRSGKYETVFPTATGLGDLYVFVREDEAERLTVAVNAGVNHASAPLVLPAEAQLLWGYGKREEGGIRVPPRSAAVWSEKR